MSSKTNIIIKPSKRGTFNAAASRRGLGTQEFASKVLANPGNYTEAMRKKAQFAKNATKFEHELGGNVLPEYGLGGDIFGGAIGGASAGAALGPWGAVAGAGLGIVSGIFSGNAKKKQEEAQRKAMEHQQSVQRGLANYAAQGQQEIYQAEFEGGGEVVPADTSWQQNWLNKRQDILQQNIDTAKSGIGNNPYSYATAGSAMIDVNKNLANAQLFKGTRDQWVDYTGLGDAWRSEAVKGGYNTPTNTIWANNPVTEQHEIAHKGNVSKYLTPVLQEKTNKYKSQIDAYLARPNASSKETTNKKLNPSELYSKMTEIRFEYGLDPSKPVTKEQIKQMRSEEFMKGEGQGNYLFDIFNDEALEDYLNNIASNTTENTNTVMAKKGALILEDGGEVRNLAISNAVTSKLRDAVPAWDTIQAVQNPMYVNKMLSTYMKNPKLEVVGQGALQKGSEQEKFIRSKWEYPYSSYSTIRDKGTGAINYYPTLTEAELQDVAKSTGRKVYQKGGKVSDNMGQLPEGEYNVLYTSIKKGLPLAKKALNALGTASRGGGLPLLNALPDIMEIYEDSKLKGVEKDTRVNELLKQRSQYDVTGRDALKYNPIMANGGMTNANVELEGGESGVLPDGSNFNVEGPSHANGGVPMNLPPTTRVYSDKLKMPGTDKTFSDINKDHSKQISKYQSVLDDAHSTRLAKKTAEKMISKIEAKQNQIFDVQQSMNGNSNGEVKGNLPKGVKGLEVIDPMKSQGLGSINLQPRGVMPSVNTLATTKGLEVMTPMKSKGLDSISLSPRGGMHPMQSRGTDSINLQPNGVMPSGKTLAPMSTQAPAKSGGLNLGGASNVIGGIAAAAPMIYNIGQGLFGKSESYDPNTYANQNAGAALSTMRNRKFDINPTLEANKTAFGMANRNIASASRTRGEMLSGYAATGSAKAQADAAARAQKSNIEAGYRGETAQMSANLGQQQAATNLQIADINSRNRAAQQNYLSTGLTQLSQFAQNKQLMKSQQQADQMRISALESLMPNYVVDMKTGRLTYKPTEG